MLAVDCTFILMSTMESHVMNLSTLTSIMRGNKGVTHANFIGGPDQEETADIRMVGGCLMVLHVRILTCLERTTQVFLSTIGPKKFSRSHSLVSHSESKSILKIGKNDFKNG